MGQDVDRGFMEQALALAAIGEGRTSPNPRVGCVLVREGEVVGRGYHAAWGQPHAETVAVAEAGDRAAGATLFVNLEPCAHQGRTPPCIELLLECGIRRVVAAMQDPDPRVNGRGFDALRQAGVEVEIGLLGEQARRLNEAFVHWHGTGRPLVTLKAAASLDGRLSAADGNSRWISGAAARRFAHRLRLCHDAVLVGGQTVRRDAPRLTVRLPGITAGRLRVVVSSSLRLDPAAPVFRRESGQPPSRIYTTAEAASRNGSSFDGIAEVVVTPEVPGGLDLQWLVEDLGRLGIQSVLVEGGGRTLASFLDAGLAHRLALFLAGKFLGDGGSTALIAAPAVAQPDAGSSIERRDLIALGDDLLILAAIESRT